jgi:hypothetical protein
MRFQVDYLQYQDQLLIRESGEKLQVFDPIRRKFVALTPEEHVRQLLLQFLLINMAYPRKRLRTEVGIAVNGMPRRCDLIVYAPQAKPWLVAECKAPSVPINQSVADQAARYNIALQASFLLITNGLDTRCCAINLEQKTWTWMDGLPKAPKTTSP